MHQVGSNRTRMAEVRSAGQWADVHGVGRGVDLERVGAYC
jgi:hypothetical protein